MFGRRNSLRVAVAVMGIVMVLFSSAQQARLFCFLGVCHPSSEHECSSSSCSAGSCSSSYRQKDQASTEVTSNPDGLGQPCPCPDACWCNADQQPVESSRLLHVSAELTFKSLQAEAVLTQVTSEDQEINATNWWDDGSTRVETGCARCARLCRFLI